MPQLSRIIELSNKVFKSESKLSVIVRNIFDKSCLWTMPESRRGLTFVVWLYLLVLCSCFLVFIYLVLYVHDFFLFVELENKATSITFLSTPFPTHFQVYVALQCFHYILCCVLQMWIILIVIILIIIIIIVGK